MFSIPKINCEVVFSWSCTWKASGKRTWQTGKCKGFSYNYLLIIYCNYIALTGVQPFKTTIGWSLVHWSLYSFKDHFLAEICPQIYHAQLATKQPNLTQPCLWQWRWLPIQWLNPNPHQEQYLVWGTIRNGHAMWSVLLCDSCWSTLSLNFCCFERTW